MKNTQIIAIDLDDTLLQDDITISDFSVEIIQKVARTGRRIVLASGRTDGAILPYVRRLDIAGMQEGRFIISQNGAVILDMHKRMPIYERFVDPEVLIEVYHTATKRNLYPHVYGENIIYVPKMNPRTEHDMKLSQIKAEVIDDYEGFLRKVHPKMVVPGDPEVLAELQRDLAHLKGKDCDMFTSKPYYLEILPLNSSKGEALMFLADHLGINRKNTMCFGDSWNDESMMRLTEHSVAMKNGADGIKKIAKHTTEFTNNEDGVARFLEKHLL